MKTVKTAGLLPILSALCFGCAGRVEPAGVLLDGGNVDSGAPESEVSASTECRGLIADAGACAAPACTTNLGEAERTIACIADWCQPSWCGTITVTVNGPPGGRLCRDALTIPNVELQRCFLDKTEILSFAGCADRGTVITVERPCPK